MIDQFDINVLVRWLCLARTKGTDRIRIVAGDKPGIYIVTELPPKGDHT